MTGKRPPLSGPVLALALLLALLGACHQGPQPFVNLAPVFTSTPVTGAGVGVLYTYGVSATDPDPGDTLTITAPTLPGWLTLNDYGNGTATLAGTPATAGSYPVALRVTDNHGASDSQSFTIAVGSTNAPPSFTSTPGDQTVLRNTLTPNGVSVAFGVSDPDGDPLTVGARSSDQAVVPDAGLAPSCAAGSCTLSFTPSPDATAVVTITLTVSDGQDSTSASFAVLVQPRLVLNTNNGGYGSLRQALLDAVPGDVIGFDTAGVFATAQTIALQGQLVVTKTLSIEGTDIGGTPGVSLSGQNSVRVMELTSNITVVVRNVQIVNGNAPGTCGTVGGGASCGGGVFLNTGSRLTLEDSVVQGNHAAFAGGGIFIDDATLNLRRTRLSINTAGTLGGGIANDDGTLVVEGSMIGTGSAQGGGGIANAGSAATALINSSLRSNTATNGGGIYNAGPQAAVEITDSDLDSNTASSAGGGIANVLGSVGLQNGVVATNKGDDGAGIYNDGGAIVLLGQSEVRGNQGQFGGGIYSKGAAATVVIDDSTVGGSELSDGNSVSDAGGGIFNQGGSLTLRNASAVSNNTADDAGGIYNAGGTVAIQDSNVSANAANFGGGILNTSGGSLTVTGGGISGNSARGSGGGIYNGSGASLALHGAFIGGRNLATGNRANNDGGGVYNAGHPFGIYDCSELVFNIADADENGSGQGGGYYTTVSPTIDLSCPPDISGNVPDQTWP